MRTIYLDYNATTPVALEVRDAIIPFLSEHFGNPSSSHTLGRAANEAVRDARSRVAQLLGVTAEEIVFTSCGTESNNLALKGVAFRQAPAGSGHLVISALEHPAVMEPARWLEQLGYSLSVVAADKRGLVDPTRVAAALRPDTVLVSVMHSNNEIGTIQPIRDIARICRERGILVHTDASQSVGKVPVRVDEMAVDLVTITGHKFYAPKGVGALYVRHGVALEPVLHGAGHEGGMRGGTENVPFIVGLGMAATLAERRLDEVQQRTSVLRDRLELRLMETLGDHASVNGAGAPRLPNTLSINFHGVSAMELLRRCPELCVSTGAACHSGSTRLSATQSAIGLKPEAAQGTIRLSLGWHTTEEEVERTASLLLAAWEGRGS